MLKTGLCVSRKRALPKWETNRALCCSPESYVKAPLELGLIDTNWWSRLVRLKMMKLLLADMWLWPVTHYFNKMTLCLPPFARVSRIGADLLEYFLLSFSFHCSLFFRTLYLVTSAFKINFWVGQVIQSQLLQRLDRNLQHSEETQWCKLTSVLPCFVHLSLFNGTCQTALRCITAVSLHVDVFHLQKSSWILFTLDCG